MSDKWKIQLVSPNGDVVADENLGYASATPEMSLALRDIKAFLETSTWSGSKLVLLDAQQMLCNERFFEWHSFRLTWGNTDPLTSFAAYSDGSSLEWTLYFWSNNRLQKLISGSLPEGWWQLSEDQRWQYVNSGK